MRGGQRRFLGYTPKPTSSKGSRQPGRPHNPTPSPPQKSSGSRAGETNCQTETADVTLKLEQTGTALATRTLVHWIFITLWFLQSGPNWTGLQQPRREISQQVFLMLAAGRLWEIGAYALVANPKYVLGGLVSP